MKHEELIKRHDIEPAIFEALMPIMGALVERFTERLTRRLAIVTERLAAAGGDFEQAYPYPKSNLSRGAYIAAREDRSDAQTFLVDDGDRNKHRYSSNPPRWMVIRPDAQAWVEARALKMAQDTFLAYAIKLTKKVRSRDTSTVAGANYTGHGDPWGFSTLTVALNSGVIQIWRTKMIVNTSILGKAFNQFPTTLRK